jgi:autophagy-related protein 5
VCVCVCDGMTDFDVVRSVWEGRVPIAVSRALEEFVSDEPKGEPFFLLAPRCSYLALCIEKLRSHFHVSSGSVSDIWFEYKKRPLKWSVPIGVLFDSYAGSPDELWAITVHFKGAEDLPNSFIRYPDLPTLESHYISRLKEAVFLKGGSGLSDGHNSTENKRQMWLALVQDDLDQFHRLNDKLVLPPDGWVKKVPFRVYVITADHLSDTKFFVVTVIQEPFSPVANNTPRTLSDLMQLLFGEQQSESIMLHGVYLNFDTPL